MTDRLERPSRRGVIAGAAAAGVAWSAPVVRSSPAAAQGSGCSLLGVTSTPFCAIDPIRPYGVEFSETVTGCAGTYSVGIFVETTFLGCVPLPPGGGPLVSFVDSVPHLEVSVTFQLREGPSCDGSLLGSTTILASTAQTCIPPDGAPLDGPPARAGAPTLTF